MIDYVAPLKKGLIFAVKPKRFLPLLILDIAAFFVVLLATMLNLSEITNILNAASMVSKANSFGLFNFLWLGLGFVVIFIVWGLIRLWIAGALVYQSYREKEYNKSWTAARQRYPVYLAATIIAAALFVGLAFIPFIFLFAIIFGLLFFFISQTVMLGNRGVLGSLRESINIFEKNPLKVIAMAILSVIVILVIKLIFMLPLWFTLIPLFPADTTMTTEAVSPGPLMSMITFLLSNLPVLVPGIIIYLIGQAVADVFFIKAQTEYYIQLKSKKFKLL